MINQLRKYMAADQPIEIIYIDRKGKSSQRTVRVLEIKDDRVKAFCCIKRAPRVFAFENILAIQPVVKRHVAGY